MKRVVAVVRVVLGFYYLANGFNFFLGIYKFPPVHNSVANTLMGGFVQSGMFDIVKVIEILTGLSLVLNLFAPLALVLSYPIVVIIGYIDVFILGVELGGIVNGGAFFLVDTVLLLMYLPYYRSMFVLRGIPDPSMSVFGELGRRTVEAPQRPF